MINSPLQRAGSNLYLAKNNTWQKNIKFFSLSWTQPIRIIKLANKPHTSFAATKKVLDLKRNPGGVEISNHPGMVDRSHVESPLVQPGFAPLSWPTWVTSQRQMYKAGIFDTVFRSSPPSWRVMENAHSGSSGYNNC